MTSIAIGRFTGVAAMLAGVVFAGAPAAAQAPSPSEVTFKQVAPDLYFLFEFTSSNAVVLTTDDGVLVIDTRQHPRDGQDLVDRIRKITDKPIKWVINSHFHGDHHFGKTNAAVEFTPLLDAVRDYSVVLRRLESIRDPLPNSLAAVLVIGAA